MIATYLQEPVLQPMAAPEDGRWWWLREPFTFVVDGVGYTVPRRFGTDLASIPRLLRWLLPSDACAAAAAVAHDYLGRHGIGSLAWQDEVFRELLLDRAARLAPGWRRWREERRADILWLGLWIARPFRNQSRAHEQEMQ